MKRTLLTYIIWSFGVLLLNTLPAIGTESLSKEIGLPVKTILIDPWYGGKERGPLIGQKYGKDITLEIAQKLRELLETAGFKVYLTRSKDEFVTLEQRLMIGKSRGADVHLAVKVSKSKNDCVNIFVASPPAKKHLEESKTHTAEELGEIFNDLITASIREESLSLAGVIRDKFKIGSAFTCIAMWKSKGYILKNAQVPSLMIDFHISPTTKLPPVVDSAAVDKITVLLADSMKEYSEQRKLKKEVN